MANVWFRRLLKVPVIRHVYIQLWVCFNTVKYTIRCEKFVLEEAHKGTPTGEAVRLALINERSHINDVRNKFLNDICWDEQ